MVEFFFLVVSLSSIHMLKCNCIEIYENKRDIRKTVRVCLNCNYSNLTVIKIVNISDEFFIIRRFTDISFIQCGIDWKEFYQSEF